MTVTYFIFFILGLILIRLLELAVSKRHAEWLLAQGAVEYGRGHYPYMVALHTCFIISLMVEFYLQPVKSFNIWLLLFFVVLMIVKYRVISTLGKYWTTRIYRIPGAPLVRTGVYAYFRHPNYYIVITEILVIPLIFSLYYTAGIFSVLNALMLLVRIREEERALRG